MFALVAVHRVRRQVRDGHGLVTRERTEEVKERRRKKSMDGSIPKNSKQRAWTVESLKI
jgi:hypothetical protein